MRDTYRPYRTAAGFRPKPGQAVQLAVRFTDDEMVAIVNLSRARGKSAASVVRDLVNRGLKTMRGEKL